MASSLTFERVEPRSISSLVRFSLSWTSRDLFATSTATSLGMTMTPLSSPTIQSPVRTLWPPTVTSIPMPP